MIIKGIPSGDMECWCFLVTRETFQEMTGKPPDETDEHHAKLKGDAGKYRFRLYPGQLIDQYDMNLTGKRVILSVEARLDE